MKDGQPRFSVVVPTFRRPDELATCLRTLLDLDYPREGFEVIVVDDGTNVSLQHAIEPVEEKLRVTLVRQQHGGPARARNTGAEHARGTYLAFTDDDCRVSADWLCQLESVLDRDPTCAVGGRTVNLLADNPYSSASQLLTGYLYGYYNQLSDRSGFFTSNNLAVASSEFQSIGGFDASFTFAGGEDREFCDRWLSSGRRLCYVGDAVVFHAHKLGLRLFWRQHFTYGRGAYYFHKARARRGGGRVRVEPAAFYLGIVRYPFVRNRLERALPLAALMMTSQVANAVGFIWERARKGR